MDTNFRKEEVGQKRRAVANGTVEQRVLFAREKESGWTLVEYIFT